MHISKKPNYMEWMMKIIRFAFMLIVWCLVTRQNNFAQIRLPELIGDSMVLQRDTPLKLWGWASPGEKVSVTFRGKKVSTRSNMEGKWQVAFPAMKAGGPYEMQLAGKNRLTLKGILIGDVWLCAGQSNMVHQLGLHDITYAEDIAQANFPEIRQFWVPTATSLLGPQQELKPSAWKWANPNDVRDFSAVAYFFARAIYQQYHIPIGIINSSVGGTPIEAWTSAEGLSNFDSIQSVIIRNQDTAYVKSRNEAFLNNPQDQALWPDKGLEEGREWFRPDSTAKGWRTINIPGYWEDQGIRDLDGVVWYRREITLPGSLAGKGGKLFMGRIVDADQVYVNGKEIGHTTYQYPQRRYKIPDGLLKAGKNLIVIRVENSAGRGGFVPDKPYELKVGDHSIDLKGYWHYKVGQVYRPVERRGPGMFIAQNQPTALYNAMIAPFTHYPIKGVLWYQGESNSGNARDYEKLLPALIQDWRRQFSNPDLPFYYVQLPNFGDASYLPVESDWAILREAALKTLVLPHTGMAVTIDLGEWNDIHPDNKKGVGDRLSLIARNRSYGEKDVVYSGPLYQSAEIKGNKIIVHFSHTGNGLIAVDGEELSEFAIAGTDKKFVWAKAKILGNQIEVWADEVPEPKYVRYAWSDNPVNPNLYNVEGLPASPFRTDVETP